MTDTDKPKRELTEAEIEQRRQAGSKPKTMTDAALQQRRDAAQLSTGPVTPEGKAASSRNNWKTGEHSVVAKAQLWKEMGMGVMSRPCKSTCAQYPCSLVDNGTTRPGQDCMDKQVYVEAFDALINTMRTGDTAFSHGVLATIGAGAVDTIVQMRNIIATKMYVERPVFNKKGDVIMIPKEGGEEGEEAPLTITEINPIIPQYYKMLQAAGINLPELLATPKSVAKADSDDKAADAVADMFESLQQLGMNKGRTFNGESEVVE